LDIKKTCQEVKKTCLDVKKNLDWMLKNLGWRLKKPCLEVNEILLKNTKICCLGNMVEKIMHGEWKKLSGK